MTIGEKDGDVEKGATASRTSNKVINLKVCCVVSIVILLEKGKMTSTNSTWT